MVEIGNTEAHLRQGQEVLWGDSHVTFERRPDVGFGNDNIYTPFGGTDDVFNEFERRRGRFLTEPPSVRDPDCPRAAVDNFLVNDDDRDMEAARL